MRFLLVMIAFTLAACSQGPKNRFAEHQRRGTPPPPKEAPKKVIKDEPDYHGMVAEGALLIDVRTPAEFARGSVPGAKNVPYEELLQRLDAFGSHEQTVILFCESGRRAGLAKAILVQQGWTDVHNMGSHRDW